MSCCNAGKQFSKDAPPPTTHTAVINVVLTRNYFLLFPPIALCSSLQCPFLSDASEIASHLSCSSVCLSFSKARALSCCKSAAVSIFRPEERVQKWRRIFPFQFTLLNGGSARYTDWTPLINSVMEIHYQNNGRQVKRSCVTRASLLVSASP